MKNYLLGLTFLFAANVAVGQEIKYGIKGGVNFANQSINAQGVSASFSSLTSFHVHGILDYGFSPSFSFQPGIGLSGKGFKVSTNGSDAKMNVLYLDIPMNFLGKIPVPALGKIFLGGGPYAGINISEKAKSDGQTIDGADSYKTADFGLNIIGGIEFKNHMTLNANYGFGLTNVAKDVEGDASVKNKVFSLSIGYLF